MTSTDLQLFEFHKHPVRVVTIDGEPWFVLTDLCRVLGIGSSSAVTDVKKRLDLSTLDSTKVTNTAGFARDTDIVNEAGMYEVVIRSDKPEAVTFRRWITGRVLPAIRKTGSYSHRPASPQQLPSKKELAQWVVEAEERAERAERARVEAEIHARQLELPAAAWNELADAAGDYSVADAAKVLSRDPNIATGERRLFQTMSGLGWTYRREGRWRAFQTQVEIGRLTEKVGRPFWHEGRRALVAGEPTVRITPKGLGELHRRLGGGQLALVVAAS